MLGDGGESLLGGYGGSSAPTYAQDPAVPCAGGLEPCTTLTTLFSSYDSDSPALVGGLVAGPLAASDDYEHDRWEPSARAGIENNAGLTGALAGVVGLDAGYWQRCQQYSGAVSVHPVCGTSFML